MHRAINAAVLVGAMWAICFSPVIDAFAQGIRPFVASAVDLEIVPSQIANFLAALKENGAATRRNKVTRWARSRRRRYDREPGLF